MRRVLFFSILIVVGIFYCSKIIFSASQLEVVINEVAWMGTNISANDEWLELKNNTNQDIDLSGWILSSQDGSINISLSGIITAQGFFLLERTDNESVPDIDADLIYSGILGNDGEVLELRDAEGNLIDYIDCSDGWYGGNNDTKSTMERVNSNLPSDSVNWQNSFLNGGTPKAENSQEPIINQPPIALAGSDQAIDLGQLVYFDGSGSYDPDGLIVSYLWDFGDGQSGLNATTLHQYATSGNFLASLTVIDDDGATSSDELVVIVMDVATSTPQIINPSEVVINEFMSDVDTGQNEWIELYNNTTSTVDLTGWTLEDGVGVIIQASGTVPALGFLTFDLSSAKLNNSGDVVFLKDNEDNIIDQVSYGNWDDGNILDNAPAASKTRSTARKVDGLDSDSDINDFAVTITPTKNQSNIITPVPSLPPSSGGGGGSIYVKKDQSYNPSDIVVNELVSDPEEGEEEWVELYNNTSEEIDLEGWYLQDGSGAKTSLRGIIRSKLFVVIEKIKGNLNNAGDKLGLFDVTGKLINLVVYGNWDEGNTGKNALLASDPYALARRIDGQDSGNYLNDFALTKKKTPGSTNIIENEDILDTTFDSWIVINEILPNPAGDDSENEFIELKNIGEQAIDLAGYILSDASRKKYVIKKEDFDETLINAGDFLVVYRRVSKIALNNSGEETVSLHSPLGDLIDQVIYSGSVAEDNSYNFTSEGNYAWSVEVTAGRDNVIRVVNESPVAIMNMNREFVSPGEEIIFDAGESNDPDGEIVAYYWDFGDGQVGEGVVIAHSYKDNGTYRLFLTVKDDQELTTTAEYIIEVGLDLVRDQNNFLDQSVIISELLPNPIGPDAEGEFIELYNPNNHSINLKGWQMDDAEGGSRPYVIKDLVIPAYGFAVLGRKLTGLALNNDHDSVRLFNDRGQLVDSVDYNGAKEGLAYALGVDLSWQWTSQPTPGAANVFTAVAGATIKDKKQVFNVSLTEVRELEVGDKVRVRGLVSVEPGILGSQIFYLAGSGIQIYCYKKDFPQIKVGDYVEVVGELSESGGEARIKVSGQNDIVLLQDKPEEPLTPHELLIADIGESSEGYLVRITGEVIEIRGSNIYLDDDGEEVPVYLKSTTGIKAKDLGITEGDRVEVVGIVSQTKTGYRVLPRYAKDVVKLEGTVLGMVETDVAVAPYNQINKYLVAIIVFMALAIGWLAWQQHQLVKTIDKGQIN